MADPHNPHDELDLPLDESPLAEPGQWEAAGGASDFEFPAELEGLAGPPELPVAGFGEPQTGALEGSVEVPPLPSEEAQTADSVPATDETGVEPVAADEPAGEEALVGVGEESGAADAEGKPAKRRINWLALGEWVGVTVAVIVVYLLARTYTVAESWKAAWLTSGWLVGDFNGGYLVLMIVLGFTIWKTRGVWTSPEVSAPYTVMLAVTLAALLTAVYCLGLELARYDWDQKAKKAKQLPLASAAQRLSEKDNNWVV